MLVSLFGRPGSGKTTVGDSLQIHHGFKHLPLGRILKTPEKVSEMGLDPDRVHQALASGRTIDDPRLLAWLDIEIASSPCPVVVDGYPRIAAAVVPFNRLVIDKLATTEVIALHIQCGADTASERIRQRGRPDDRTTSLGDRNDEYSRVQLPLLGQLTSRVRIVEIDSESEEDIVIARVIAALPLLGDKIS